MYTQKNMVSFIPNLAPVMEKTKAGPNKGFDKGQSQGFKDVFHQAVNSNSKPNVLQNSRRKEQYSVEQKQYSIQRGQKDRGRDYVEAAENNRRETKSERLEQTQKPQTTYRDIQKVKEGENVVDEETIKEDLTASSLAQVLGMQVEDLKKVLDSLDIDIHELADPSKVAGVVEKLGGVLGLDPGQRETLKEMLAVIHQKVMEAMEEVRMDSKPQEMVVKKESNEGHQEKQAVTNEVHTPQNLNSPDSQSVQPSKLFNQLKEKIEQLVQQFKEDPGQVTKEISSTMDKVIVQQDLVKILESKGAAQKNRIEGQKAGQDKAESTQIVEGKPDATNGDKNLKQQGGEKGQGNSLGNAEFAKTGSIASKASTSQETQSPFSEAMNNQVQKNGDIKEVARVQREVPIPKSEIINQVVQKAKVVLTGDKSEMVMDLKPDSLGKLSLKIVTERGIVMAKFIAESQQVKEVIESNMQLLKDSLQKQGLAVQEFSVSVNQNPYRGSQQDNFSEHKGNRKGQGETGTGVKISATADIAHHQQRINPYDNLGDSKINLTA